jgi:hypothetical protein
MRFRLQTLLEVSLLSLEIALIVKIFDVVCSNVDLTEAACRTSEYLVTMLCQI